MGGGRFGFGGRAVNVGCAGGKTASEAAREWAVGADKVDGREGGGGGGAAAAVDEGLAGVGSFVGCITDLRDTSGDMLRVGGTCRRARGGGATRVIDFDGIFCARAGGSLICALVAILYMGRWRRWRSFNLRTGGRWWRNIV